MENTVFGKEENKNAGILTENLENYCVRNGSGDSPLFELADRLKDLKDQKKQKELELRNINDMIFEIDAALSEFMIIKLHSWRHYLLFDNKYKGLSGGRT